MIWLFMEVLFDSMLPTLTVLTSLFVHSHLVFVVYPTYICKFDEFKYDLMMMVVITLMCTSVPLHCACFSRSRSLSSLPSSTTVSTTLLRLPSSYLSTAAVFSHSWYLSRPTVVNFFFQDGVLFSSKENAKFWPMLAPFDQFWIFCRKFTHFLVPLLKA